MLLDSPSNLQALLLVVIDIADYLMQSNNLRFAGKTDVLIARLTIDILDDVSIVDIAPAGKIQQVVASSNRLLHSLHRSALLADIDLDLSGDWTLLVIDLQKANKRLIVGVLHLDTSDLDLLDELPFVRIHRIELVHHVVLIDMRRRIPQRTKGVEGSNRRLALGSRIDALWLIDDDDRVSCLDKLDRSAAIHAIVRAMNDISLALLLRIVKALSEGIDVDDHNLNTVVRREVTNLTELLRVVDEVIIADVVVQTLEMLLRHLQ